MTAELARIWDTAWRVTPISGWSVAIAVVGAVLALLVWRPLVRRTGWTPVPTLLALLSLVGVAALTLGPGAIAYDVSLRQCLVDAAHLTLRQLRWLRYSADGLLNVVLLLPFGLTAVLALRRVWPVALVVVLVPLVVEAVQTLIPGRLCSPTDYLTNVAGGLAGVALGALVLGLDRWAGARVRA